MTSIKQKQSFFLVLPVDNADGTITPPDADGAASTETIEEAIEQASSASEDCGGVYYVYECHPVRRVSAYRVKVEEIDGPYAVREVQP